MGKFTRLALSFLSIGLATCVAQGTGSVAPTDHAPIVHHAVATESGLLTQVRSRERINGLPKDVFRFWWVGEDEPEPIADRFVTVPNHPTGPPAWTIHRGMISFVMDSEHGRAPHPNLRMGVSVHAVRYPLAWWKHQHIKPIEDPEERRQQYAEVRAVDGETGLILWPLKGEYEDRPRNEVLYDWDLRYAYGFSGPTQADLFVAEGDQLWWTTADDTGPKSGDVFMTFEPEATEIIGGFHALRAGERLVLVEENGRVFSSPRDGHRPIGRLTDWPSAEETERDVYLLEDAETNKLRAVEVVTDDEGTKRVRSLIYQHEADGRHPNPFTNDLPRAEVREWLVRLSDSLDRER